MCECDFMSIVFCFDITVWCDGRQLTIKWNGCSHATERFVYTNTVRYIKKAYEDKYGSYKEKDYKFIIMSPVAHTIDKDSDIRIEDIVENVGVKIVIIGTNNF